jgi:hypothetical protein
MDPDTMTHLLRGGNIDMPERIQRGIWPHPPIPLKEVEKHLVRVIKHMTWFPGTIEEMGLDSPEIEAQTTIENIGDIKYVCHFADHYRHITKRFSTAKDAVKFYLKWALHLPGDLDGWKVR